jgi:hypothetical protein
MRNLDHLTSTAVPGGAAMSHAIVISRPDAESIRATEEEEGEAVDFSNLSDTGCCTSNSSLMKAFYRLGTASTLSPASATTSYFHGFVT